MVQKSKKTLIGIIVDVSYSMQENWGNNITNRQTKIDVIKNALNNEFKRLNVVYSKKEKEDICLFCLGIGFILPFKLMGVELKDGKEKEVKNSSSTEYVGVICDILALSEIVPSSDKLDKIKREIKQFWDEKADEFLHDIRIEEDTETLLRQTVEEGLVNSKIDDNSIIRRIAAFFSSRFEEKVVKEKAKYLSRRLLKDVTTTSENIFKRNKKRYEGLIQSKITAFANEQIQYMLQRNGLGFSLETILNNFDKDKMRLLAESIYQELKKDVFKEFRNVWVRNRIDIILAKYSHFSRLNLTEVKNLTEQSIKNTGWKSLKPFVEQTVFNIFSTEFEKVSNDRFRDWLELASKREVTRKLSEIINVLPDTTEKTIYSKTYMFGGTPMLEALNLATLRLLDSRFSDFDKRLLIISDGEYRNEVEVRQVASLLKSENIVILCGYVGNTSVIETLKESLNRHSINGAKNLMEISSTIENFPEIVEYIERGEVKTELKNRLCIQINHPKHLTTLIESLTKNKN